MKISYNGTQAKITTVADMARGEAFAFDNYYYMRVEIDCKGLSPRIPSGDRAVVNLHSGTVRLLSRSEEVKPLTSKVVLRDRVLHDCQEG